MIDEFDYHQLTEIYLLLSPHSSQDRYMVDVPTFCNLLPYFFRCDIQMEYRHFSIFPLTGITAKERVCKRIHICFPFLWPFYVHQKMGVGSLGGRIMGTSVTGGQSHRGQSLLGGKVHWGEGSPHLEKSVDGPQMYFFGPQNA